MCSTASPSWIVPAAPGPGSPNTIGSTNSSLTSRAYAARTAARARGTARPDQCGVAVEGAVADGGGDLHERLVDDAAGAEVEVAHLGVAHEPVGEAHVLARGGERGVRRGGPPARPHRVVGQ